MHPPPIHLSFLIQNENLAINVRAAYQGLAERVARSGGRLRIVSLDPIMHQGVSRLLADLPTRIESVPIASPTPFYHLTGAAQLRFLLSARGPLSRQFEGTGILVIDSPGAVQRMMSRPVRSAGRVVMALDALLYQLDPRRDRRWRRSLSAVAEKLGLDPYVPGHPAGAALDDVLVPHPSAARALRAAGSTARIHQVVFPRVEAALGDGAVEDLPPWEEDLRLLYATGAYRWHGLEPWDEMQMQEIADLCELAEEDPRVSVRVRLHPRESHERFHRLALPPNVEVSAPETPSLMALRGCHALLTSRSSMALEAALLGIPTFVSHRRFPPPGADEFATTSPSVTVVNDFRCVRELYPGAVSRALVPEGLGFAEAILDGPAFNRKTPGPF